MNQKGSIRSNVIAELAKIRQQDHYYEDGRILCSMCTQPHPIALKAYQMFQGSNLGDPKLFPGSIQIEREVVEQLSALLHGQDCSGFIVSGGTEANLMAMLAARNKKQTQSPEVILPQSAHFSFTKIFQILNIKPVYSNLDSRFGAHPGSIQKCINKNTVAIVGTAGTAELGVIDPIYELAKIASTNNIWLHVDAAFGGLIIPFINEFKKKFDFSIDAVESITVDPHKMGMAAIPAGGILFRNNKSIDLLKTETPYLSDEFQHTFIGTRTGASVASAWAVFRLLGKEGFEKIVADCLKNTRFLASELKKTGMSLVREPELNIVAFRSNKSTKSLAQKLRSQGWFISYIPRYDCIRVVIMPHVKRKNLIAFMSDITKIENL